MDSPQPDLCEDLDSSQPVEAPLTKLPWVYENGWDFGAMQKHARAQIPQLPMKKTSTWIAIIYHFIARSADIPRTNGFQFIKAHPNITAKTLRYTYFSRHPLEELYLTFNGIPLHDHVQVKHLWKASPYHERLVVLRAIEGEMTAEEDDGALRSLEVFRSGACQAGNYHDNPIALNSDDDIDSASESAREELDGTRVNVDDTSESEEEDERRVTKKARTTFPDGYSPMVPENAVELKSSSVGAEVVDGNASALNNSPRSPARSHGDDSEDASDEGAEDADDELPPPTASRKRKRDPKSEEKSGTQADESDSTIMNQSRHLSPLSEEEEYYGERDLPNFPEELLARMEDFDDETRIALTNARIHLCGVCRKQMTLMPWTRFDENHGPLCTIHSRYQLEYKGFEQVLERFDNEVEHAADEKSRFDHANTDPDFPADVFPEQNQQAFEAPNSTLSYTMDVEDHVRLDSPSQQLFNDLERHFSTNPSSDFDALFKSNPSSSTAINHDLYMQTISPDQIFRQSSHPSTASESSGEAYHNYERNDLDSPFFTSSSRNYTGQPCLGFQSPRPHQHLSEQENDDGSSASEPEYMPPGGFIAQDPDDYMSETNGGLARREGDDTSDEEVSEEEMPVDAAAKDDPDDEDYED